MNGIDESQLTAASSERYAPATSKTHNQFLSTSLSIKDHFFRCVAWVASKIFHVTGFNVFRRISTDLALRITPTAQKVQSKWEEVIVDRSIEGELNFYQQVCNLCQLREFEKATPEIKRAKAIEIHKFVEDHEDQFGGNSKVNLNRMIDSIRLMLKTITGTDQVSNITKEILESSLESLKAFLHLRR